MKRLVSFVLKTFITILKSVQKIKSSFKFQEPWLFLKFDNTIPNLNQRTAIEGNCLLYF